MRIALGQGRWEEAERLSQTALRLNPLFPEAHYCLAVASYKQGKLDTAREAALALQSSPRAAEFPESLQLLGTLLGKAGMFQQAAHFFHLYLVVRPDSPAADEVERYLVEWEALGVIQPPADTTGQPQ
ncbi:MAG: tetratricopeptide repeat protein [Acidobacteria bacterium]|nr:tetratricopeptide repeat protein [Acidobacteriota bacterium]